MVNSSACRSELTRAYRAARMVWSMTLGPPCFFVVDTCFFVMTLLLLDAARPLANHRQDLLIGQRPQFVFQAMAFETTLHQAIPPFPLVSHDDSPEPQEAPWVRAKRSRPASPLK